MDQNRDGDGVELVPASRRGSLTVHRLFGFFQSLHLMARKGDLGKGDRGGRCSFAAFAKQRNRFLDAGSAGRIDRGVFFQIIGGEGDRNLWGELGEFLAVGFGGFEIRIDLQCRGHE